MKTPAPHKTGTVDEGLGRSGEAPIDSAEFRTLMRKVASSVAVITTRYGSEDHGMTATAVTSVCADPPTILIVVNKSTRSHPLIASSGRFIVNMLGEHQRVIGDRFAGKLVDQFEGVRYRRGWHGMPIIDEAASYLECSIIERKEVGTHTIFVARVVGGEASSAHPLLYHEGEYKIASAQRCN